LVDPRPGKNRLGLDSNFLNRDREKISRVAVAMSGGVDSSLAAVLLKQAGFDVVGISLKLWPEAPGGPSASSGYPLKSARLTARRFGFRHEIIDLEDDFRRLIVEPFCRDYASGLTPSPCIRCNALIKLDIALKRALSMGADAIATGHYARVGRDASSGRYYISRAADSSKDQSYFLFELDQFQMAHLLLPLGKYSKKEVRRLAAEYDLPSADRPESQEICFVSGRSYAGLVEEITGCPREASGSILDPEGREIGRHSGIHRYTVGQRKGLGVTAPHPLFVLQIDPAKNAVIVGPRESLMQKTLVAENANYMKAAELTGARVRVRIRSAHRPAPAVASSAKGGRILIEFDEPQEAIAPGQAAVLYDEAGRILAGGWIARPAKSRPSC
jgi:tRNA-specific 2-thiouridylase